jgi:superfamily II DNA/RNA helicase
MKSMTFAEQLEICPRTIETLLSQKKTEMFPIQSACFAPLYAGSDVMARDLTGSGKTLAFALPLLERFRSEKTVGNGKLKVVCLTPTRELALQITQVFESLRNFEDEFAVVSIYGGVSYEPQLRVLEKGADFVIGTTGRIKDYVVKNQINFQNLECMILDEADRMM